VESTHQRHCHDWPHCTRKSLIDGFGLTCLRRQDTSVSQAKQAISDYKNAVGDPEGVAELMIFFCEQAAGFCSDIYTDDEGYFDALVRMFEQALKFANALSTDRRDDLVSRLDRVRTISHDFGYRVGDNMDFLLSKYTRS
jgi:hypothetical protein